MGGMLIVRTLRRKVWIPLLAIGIAALGAATLATRAPTWPLFIAYVVTPLLGTIFIVGVILVSEQAWLIARRLELAKETEADLAVARERVRFAGDLHDIQGHSLHIIKLKAALAGRLIEVDAGRVKAELGDIRTIADETITAARSLAYARHELNLPAEVESTRQLCEAAGLAVETRFDPANGDSAHPLLAQVLREATTNLLRHAHAERVWITASPVSVEVMNDGVTDGARPVLSGLARLRSRLEAVGGELRLEQPPGRFVVAAGIPPASSEGAA
ncbi:sensor histidine kinase [Microbacterium sp. Sa4CUA7]|uniref:Sensor histidine kinase n=1 Tax=Microbacterium pullorum TaxID=2762236 RepID=A0ABR8RZE2_9MICO|nr:sensor histidine kinase [Microbacterium pullorum]